MKVQCDVCCGAEATVFCCADEAALCGACDRRVHRANKVAGKHHRLSLHPPSSSSPPPLCDICQEKKGLIFCKEDRAILCRDCDHPIHTANDRTAKHSRYLLTGATLSLHPPSSSSPDHHHPLDAACSTSSSITEYLTKTLPGWQVDDFLVDDAAAAAADAALPLSEELPPLVELDGGLPGMWAAPHVLQAPHVQFGGGDQLPGFYLDFGAKAAGLNQTVGRDTRAAAEDAVAVPQIRVPRQSAAAIPSGGGGGGKRQRAAAAWYY